MFSINILSYFSIYLAKISWIYIISPLSLPSLSSFSVQLLNPTTTITSTSKAAATLHHLLILIVRSSPRLPRLLQPLHHLLNFIGTSSSISEVKTLARISSITFPMPWSKPKFAHIEMTRSFQEGRPFLPNLSMRFEDQGLPLWFFPKAMLLPHGALMNLQRSWMVGKPEAKLFFPYFITWTPQISEDIPRLLQKHLLGMKSSFRPIWKGYKGGKKLLLKLQIVPASISKALQMGIMLWTLVLFHSFLFVILFAFLLNVRKEFNKLKFGP
jgi:hypothetical protein